MAMKEEIYEKYKTAGEIAKKAREYGKKLIKEGVLVLDVVNEVEGKILEEGADPAFPVNISINEVAAHFTPKHNDKLVFKRGDLVKLDVGAHVDGFIADTAVTVEIASSRYEKLIESTKEALKNAIKGIKPGVDVSQIGEIIGSTIEKYGFASVENLTGHSLEQFCLHAGISIPNFYDDALKGIKLERDMAVAIEPFATDGVGYVIAGKKGNIYRCLNPRRFFLRDPIAKREINFLKNEFKSLPFAERWYHKMLSKRSGLDSDYMLERLARQGYIKQYNQLIEKKSGKVAQTEHTIIIHDNGAEIIT